MLKKIGVAIIGLGFVGGQAHVPAFRKIPGANLVAVIDVDEKRAKEVSTKYNIDYYLDYKKALENPSIEAVVVAVPTPLHYKLASYAITKGKHVLCEMPLTPSISKSEELKEEANNAGVLLMPDLNFRFTPNYVKAKELIQNGAVGNPIAVTYSEYIPAKDLAKQWPSDSWAWNIEKSGGYPDFTLSVWAIDLVSWLLDSKVDKIQWMSNYSPLIGFEKFTGYNTIGIMRFSKGTVGSLHFSATVNSEEGTSNLAVFGNNTQTLKAKWNNNLNLVGDKLKQVWEFKEKGTKVWGHYQIDSYFIECILKEKKPSVTCEDAINAQRIASKIVSSYLKK